ncbi:MAG: alpha/beta hydrolase [Henriciella sp.]|jgi:pimeloyl-ACP methyl ester carboxylesterase
MADDQKPVNPNDLAVLVPYRGEKPSAPEWFDRAVETPYETHFVEVDGAKVRYQRWGETDKPGLLLVHGNGAHAHWYDFIAPYVAEEYCVVAMTFGGMGDSEWRETYAVDTFSAEQLAVCEDAGLFKNDRKPVIVSHSFGGFITMNTGSKFGDRFDGVMIVDSPVRPPDDDWDGPPSRGRGNRTYTDLTSALARFRLAPPQPCENHYIVDYIARHSLKEVPVSQGVTGWTWKFDASIWKRFEAMTRPIEMYKGITCRLAVMRGEQSVLLHEKTWKYMHTLRDDVTMISIPEAQHHVMLDQPLAFIAAVRTQLEAWQY